MGLETVTFIDDLVVTNPTTTDKRRQGDDHLRAIKLAIKNTFPNIDGAVNPTPAELNYLVGVTSLIQTQLDALQAQFDASTIVALSTIQTFALDDKSTIQTLTGTTDRIWTIPTHAAVAFDDGVTIGLCARDTANIDISPDVGVTLTSILGSGNDDITVLAGGSALIYQIIEDEWMITGDIVPA